MVPLPPKVAQLLNQLEAPPRLIAHLTLVHDVACMLTAKVDQIWPTLSYDRELVHVGAALHDLGKILHPEELSGPGHAHEVAGERLLHRYKFPDRVAQIARTHGQWATEAAVGLEDILVAVADIWWRGKRDDILENVLGQHLMLQIDELPWQVFLHLDTVATDIAELADMRLAWQSQHATGGTQR